MEKCIGCELCAGVCPAKCIYVRGADNNPEAPTSPGERLATSTRSTTCAASIDLCVEACPTQAITESKLFGSHSPTAACDLHQERTARRRRWQTSAVALGRLAPGNHDLGLDAGHLTGR